MVWLPAIRESHLPPKDLSLMLLVQALLTVVCNVCEIFFFSSHVPLRVKGLLWLGFS